jgi:hypothetical protein
MLIPPEREKETQKNFWGPYPKASFGINDTES